MIFANAWLTFDRQIGEFVQVLYWIGCVSCVRFILRRDTSVSPYSRLVPRLRAALVLCLTLDWHWICHRLAWCPPIHRHLSFAEYETCIERQICQGCILKASIGGLLMDWQICCGLALYWMIGIAMVDWCSPESSWLRIVLVPLTKWGFVTRIGIRLEDWSRIGRLVQNWHWIGGLVMDWRIGDWLANWWWICRFVQDWHQINGLVMDWQIGDGLTQNWHYIGGLVMDLQIDTGLALDWRIGNGLVLDFWCIMDWSRIIRLELDWQIGIRLVQDWWIGRVDKYCRWPGISFVPRWD